MPTKLLSRSTPIIMSMKLKIKPVTASPFGERNKPIKEKSRPNIQRMKFTIGTQLNTSPKTAIINPAVPIPLLEL